MVSVTSYVDSTTCVSSSGSGPAPIGPYGSSYWCMMGTSVGTFNVYGRAARECSTEHENITLVQVYSYGNPSCGGDVLQIETVPVDVCLPTASGSFKLSKGYSSSADTISSILYTSYSDMQCSSNPMSSTSISVSGSISSSSTSFSSSSSLTSAGICTLASVIPGSMSANGMKLYIVNEAGTPPPGAVIERVYPYSVSSASCASGDEDPIMVRYVRPKQCLWGSNNQYEKLACSSDPSK